MQLVKQTRGNPLPHSRSRAWELFNLVAAAMPPSKVGTLSSTMSPTLQYITTWLIVPWHVAQTQQ